MDVDLKTWGWSQDWQTTIDSRNKDELTPCRVIAVHRELSMVQSAVWEKPGKISGKFRHETKNLSDYPAIGDWVLADLSDNDTAVIHAILPRKTIISRKSAGTKVDEQILATNVDVIFIMTAFDDDFNVRRLERYVLLAHQAGIEPVILINKNDLARPDDERFLEASSVLTSGSVYRLSAQSNIGLEPIRAFLSSGVTGIFLGSSGVGKSTLLNTLIGHDIQSTRSVRLSDGRGRHTTTTRRMFKIPDGGLIIDTPGLREIQLWGASSALYDTFGDIGELAKKCKFGDCQHLREPGCHVQQAITERVLSEGRFQSYLKLQKEIAYLERKKDPEQAANSKRRWKKINKEMRGISDQKRKLI